MRGNRYSGWAVLTLGFAMVALSAIQAHAQTQLVPSAATEPAVPQPSAAKKPAAKQALKADTKSQQQAQKQPSSRSSRKRLSLIEQRERAAVQQRLLLQDKSLREQTDTSQRQLSRIRDQQGETLRLQQEQQRRVMVQQRRLQQPQQPGAVPRLTPGFDRPLIEQRNPTCGVPGMPLC